MAKGEAVEAQYKITPNYACCIVECKVGSAEELKFDIENLNPLKFPLQFVAEYVKQGADSRKDERAATPNQAEAAKPKESTDKKKKAETPKKNSNAWDKVPESILTELKKFVDVDAELGPGIFNLVGVDGAGEIVMAPHSKATVKIRFTPPPTRTEKGNSNTRVYFK